LVMKWCVSAEAISACAIQPTRQSNRSPSRIIERSSPVCFAGWFATLRSRWRNFKSYLAEKLELNAARISAREYHDQTRLDAVAKVVKIRLDLKSGRAVAQPLRRRPLRLCHGQGDAGLPRRASPSRSPSRPTICAISPKMSCCVSSSASVLEALKPELLAKLNEILASFTKTLSFE
jgi:hypothetical protein